MPPQGEEQTGVCRKRDGKGAEGTWDCLRGTCRASPCCSANTRRAARRAGRRGGSSSPLLGWGGTDESLDFLHSIAEPPPSPGLSLPAPLGNKQREGGRGGRDGERHRLRCRGRLTWRCLCWGWPGVRDINPGLCSPRHVLGKASLQSHQGVACE